MRQGRAKEIADLHASSDREVGQRLIFPREGAFCLPPPPQGQVRSLVLLPIPPWPRPSRDFLQQTAHAHRGDIRRRHVNTADHPLQHPIRPVERR
ncbi:hypothetical protein SAMN05444385_103309 [Tritonibacter mobilis]|nr:hypothetical protein SAMN05444385_103309 [Tritonibacter mobilis]